MKESYISSKLGLFVYKDFCPGVIMFVISMHAFTINHLQEGFLKAFYIGLFICFILQYFLTYVQLNENEMSVRRLFFIKKVYSYEDVSQVFQTISIHPVLLIIILKKGFLLNRLIITIPNSITKGPIYDLSIYYKTLDMTKFLKNKIKEMPNK